MSVVSSPNQLADRLDRTKLLVVGDLMIDEYLWGDVDRISPEAPVQVVSVTSEDFTLGGAGNVVKGESGVEYDHPPDGYPSGLR